MKAINPEISSEYSLQKCGVDSYPKPVGQRVLMKKAAKNRIRVQDFYLIEGSGDDSLIILQNGNWGRMNLEGLTLLCSLNGLTLSEAKNLTGVSGSVLKKMLKDPLTWNLVSLPGESFPKIQRHQQWSTDFSMLVLKVTNECNLKCRYCYNVGFSGGKRITEERGIDIIRNAMDHSKEGLNIVFHGGEPLLALDLMKKLCQFARKYATSCGKSILLLVQTNATIFNKEVLEFLDQYRVGIGISLDGPGSCNAFRVDHSGKPSIDQVWKGIKKLQEWGRCVNILTVITSRNADKLYDIVMEFQERGISSIQFSPYFKQGHETNVTLDIAPNPDHIEQSFEQIIQGIIYGKIQDIQVKIIRDMIGRCLSWGEPMMCFRPGPCGAGKNMVAIYDDLVYACDCLVNDRFLFGRLDDKNSLSDLVKKSPKDLLDVHHPNRLNPCSQCALSEICGGTMICRTFWNFGDPFAVDPVECQIKQKTLVRLLWNLTESRRLIEYFLKCERLSKPSSSE